MRTNIEPQAVTVAQRASRMGNAFIIISSGICICTMTTYIGTRADSPFEFLVSLLVSAVGAFTSAFGGFYLHKSSVLPISEKV